MLSHPSLVLALFAVVGLATAVSLILLGAIWTRIRALTLDETSRHVAALARRQESIEAVLRRLETARNSGGTEPASASNPVGVNLRVDRGETGGGRGPTLIAIPSLAENREPGAGSSDRATEAVVADLTLRFGPIWDRAEAGESVGAIAQASGLPIGEVDLILGLRRRIETSRSTLSSLSPPSTPSTVHPLPRIEAVPTTGRPYFDGKPDPASLSG